MKFLVIYDDNWTFGPPNDPNHKESPDGAWVEIEAENAEMAAIEVATEALHHLFEDESLTLDRDYPPLYVKNPGQLDREAVEYVYRARLEVLVREV